MALFPSAGWRVGQVAVRRQAAWNAPAKILNTWSPFTDALIILFCGLPGVGKTTLAKELAPMVDAVVLSTDKIRKELISKPVYTTGEKELVYDVMLLVAKYLHDAGVNCILDATFNSERSRRNARERLGVSPDRFQIVECVCPEDVAISRLQARKDGSSSGGGDGGGGYSDADVAVYREMKKAYEPVKEAHIIADTRLPPETNAKEIRARITREKNERQPA